MNNTLSNGFRVLEHLASTGSPHSVKEIAKTMKLPNSHACRLLKTLKETGYVEQDSSRKYRIGLKILCLSNACLKRMEIRKRLRPFLDRLAAELNKTVYMSVPLNGHPLTIDVVYPMGIIEDAAASVGQINSLNTSASGKLCAAYHPEEDLDELLAGVKFENMTEKTITDKNVFKEELKKIRTAKMAVADEERGKGIFAVAVPVFNCEGKFTAVIGVASHISSKEDEEQKKLIKNMAAEAGEAASFALGYALNKLT